MGYQNKRKRPLLSAQDELALAESIEQARAAQARIDSGCALADDDELVAIGQLARERFMEANIGLAIHLAAKAPAPAHVEREDMIQDAICGLGRAVERFDAKRGHRFSTYASWWIRQGIQQGLEATVAPVRVPTHASHDLYGALRATNGDIAHLPPKAAATLSMTSMASLDTPHHATGTPLANTISAATLDPADSHARGHDQRVAVALFNELDPTTQYAVGRRFGLDGTDPATFSEIGDDLGVSAEAARRRVQRALTRLKPLATTLAA
jgi:RNA polymerase primary sigma factor